MARIPKPNDGVSLPSICTRMLILLLCLVYLPNILAQSNGCIWNACEAFRSISPLIASCPAQTAAVDARGFASNCAYEQCGIDTAEHGVIVLDQTDDTHSGPAAAAIAKFRQAWSDTGAPLTAVLYGSDNRGASTDAYVQVPLNAPGLEFGAAWLYAVRDDSGAYGYAVYFYIHDAQQQLLVVPALLLNTTWHDAHNPTPPLPSPAKPSDWAAVRLLTGNATAIAGLVGRGGSPMVLRVSEQELRGVCGVCGGDCKPDVPPDSKEQMLWKVVGGVVGCVLVCVALFYMCQPCIRHIQRKLAEREERRRALLTPEERAAEDRQKEAAERAREARRAEERRRRLQEEVESERRRRENAERSDREYEQRAMRIQHGLPVGG